MSRRGLADGVFLAAALAFSLARYLPRLGFSTDDWDWYSLMAAAPDRSFVGLMHVVDNPTLRMRPLVLVGRAAMFAAFGTAPLGYHLSNAIVLTAVILALWLALRELVLPPLATLAVPLVFAFLPNYSTTRFWSANIQINLSMTLFLVALYCELRAQRAGGRGWVASLLALLSLTAALLTYEVVLPLVLLFPVALHYQARRWPHPLPKARRPVGMLVRLVVLVAPIVAFKALTTNRLHAEAGFADHFQRILEIAFDPNYGPFDYGFNPKRAFVVHYGHHLVALPWTLATIVRRYSDPVLFACAGVFGVATFTRLWRLAPPGAEGSRATYVGMLAWGTVAFWLGFALFLANFDVQFATEGISNRTAIGACAGLALSLVGGLGWVVSYVPSARLRRLALCGGLTALTTAGFVVLGTIGGFWVGAWERQQMVLDDVQQHFPRFPRGGTLILDGLCPYVGPAVVFESNWDLAGALGIRYDTSHLKADVVGPAMTVEHYGLATVYYSRRNFYPYGKLFVYDFGTKRIHRIPHRYAAIRYFATKRPRNRAKCSIAGHVGYGVPPF